MRRSCLLLIGFVLMSFLGRSSHVLGGDITWTCQGGDYVFQLAFYRDCNGADVSTISVNLDVWNSLTDSQRAKLEEGATWIEARNIDNIG